MARWLITSRWARRLACSVAAGVAAAFLLVLVGDRWGESRLFSQAEAAAERGDHRRAAALFAEFGARHPGDRRTPEALFRQGRIASLFLGDQEAAIRVLRQLARREGAGPWALRAQRLLAEIFEERQGDCRQAIVEYQRLIGLEPDGAGGDEARLAIARCSFALGEFGQARAEYQQLIERRPASPLRPQALLGLANTCYVTGSYPEAVQGYREALAASRDPALAAEAGFGTAAALEEAGDLEAALREFERVRSTHPNPGLVAQRIARIRDRIARRGGRLAPPANRRE